MQELVASPVDWALLLILTVSVGLGVWRGLVVEVLSVLNWVVAFLAAKWAAEPLGNLLPLDSWSSQARTLTGFTVAFLASLVLGGLVVVLMRQFMTAVGLRPIDRVLGALFGALRAVLVMVALTVLIDHTPLAQHPQWGASVGVGWVGAVARWAAPLLPPELAPYWPANGDELNARRRR